MKLKPILRKFAFIICLIIGVNGSIIADPLPDSISIDSLALHYSKIEQLVQQTRHAQLVDSIKRAELVAQISLLKENEQLKKKQLEANLKQISERDSIRQLQNLERIRSMRATTSGYPVAPFSDTLFMVYTKIGVLTPVERAAMISEKIKKLYKDDFISIDSLHIAASEFGLELVYGQATIMTVTENDAMWQEQTKEALAQGYLTTIKQAIHKEKEDNSINKLIKRIAAIVIILLALWLVIWSVRKFFNRLQHHLIQTKKHKWIKDIKYKNYTFLTTQQELRIVLWLLNAAKWVIIILALYFVFPLILSLFPFTRGWANKMLELIWSPFYSIFKSIWNYLPNLFTIAAIIFVSRYVMRFIKYVFREIEVGNLKFNNFHKDWAMPTYSIVRVLLCAFILVLIFPYLPNNNSDVFKGVSVFIGVIFSLGSSSAISNIIAGLVITYMRPFKIGDHIKIGEMRGDVIEKSLLVTRLRTLKNEEITIPNASVLSSNTVNYSVFSEQPGLIVYTSVTIGYDVSRNLVEEALIEAANRTSLVMKEPKPFVFQNGFNDYSVDYQLNAYTSEVNRQASVYSELRRNILDVFNERNIEIMSPSYHVVREENKTTIPEEYLNQQK